ncbi:MAG TPA: cytochrome c peroxidase [Hyphomicrobiaceae bacterium]|nr:cytochrome c peroxidase [Hyphomicrobiaceae bacterium]
MLSLLTALIGIATARADQVLSFTANERAAILAHGPWPQPMPPDPSNRVAAKPAAIAFGRRLFFDTRLSADGQRSCATCHDPAKAFADGRPRSLGIGGAVVDRNAIALANLRLNRWFGWDGAGDSLWAQSIRPILDSKELALTPDDLRRRVAEDAPLSSAYAQVFGSAAEADQPALVLVNVAKALAAFQETIVTGRTAFDDFRDALERNDTDAMRRYPVAAQRGLKIFVGKGQCSVCHFGPNFTNGEFDTVGLPHFAEKGRVDTGRHGGIAALATSPFTLLGRYNDDPKGAPGLATRHVEPLHRHWGEFRVPSLRSVARTAPYMHDGSLATLADVARHYSEVNEERLHGLPGQSLIRPLRLTPQEQADLAAFLESLSGEVLWAAK